MGSSCVYRRSSGIYVVRLSVPARLRQLIGRTEVHVSTGLRDQEAAKIAALQIQLGWRQKFMDLDVLRVTQRSPLLDGEGVMPLETASDVVGLSLRALCTELFGAHVRVYVMADKWCGRWVDSLYEDLDREPQTGVFEFVQGREPGRFEPEFSGLCWVDESDEALLRLASGATFTTNLVRPVSTPSAAFFPAQPMLVDASRTWLLKRDIEAIRARLAEQVTPAILAAAELNREGSRAPASEPSPDDMLLSALIDTYALEHKDRLKADHLARMKKEGAYLVELVGDVPVKEVTRQVVLTKYRDGLLSLPEDLRKARQLSGVTALRDLIAVAKEHGLPLKSQRTVDGHSRRVSEIFAYGCDHLRLSHNPFRGLVKKSSSAVQRKARDRRSIFTSDQLREIFSAPWFVEGHGTNMHWRPHYYWLPLMALHSGARITELSQLYLDDVRQIEGGDWVFDFNLNQSDKSAPSAEEMREESDFDDGSTEREGLALKTLKNANANRIVNVHPRLIELGLIRYVGALRAAGYQRLFPEIHRNGTSQRYGTAPSSWFNERFLGDQLGWARDGRLTFHSFRHTVITALSSSKVHEADVAQIAGHTRGKTTSFIVYDKDKSVSDTIAGLHFPEVDHVAPFDVDCGVRSVARALLIKSKQKRPVKPE